MGSLTFTDEFSGCLGRKAPGDIRLSLRAVVGCVLL